MTNVNITPAVNTKPADLDTLRHNVAESVASSYGAMRTYAEALCSVLPAEWYLVEHNDSSDTAKPVHAEKKALFAELKAAKHSNPSTIWARVRKYAQEHVEGVPDKAEAGEGAGDGGAVGARETRSMTRRFIDELTLLYKAGKRAESLSDKERDALTHIGSALIALGLDLSTL
jgi:hypothetical protein